MRLFRGEVGEIVIRRGETLKRDIVPPAADLRRSAAALRRLRTTIHTTRTYVHFVEHAFINGIFRRTSASEV
ncbi:hypothetical protein SBI_08426 [Streptomyces bingchenggensis BCW-1]|uniref:Uncharacterized protein n=1 Tax=Streptomyces bingchenggensis (strain BCW-1) TaxID=749414 RepID=D7BSP7_STRBB|nr:hypothetical protein SBI_08426 [Streptomyces bingchenggensis BCW-1]